MRHEAIVIGVRGGATPCHVRQVAGEVAPPKPRAIPKRPIAPRSSGLKPFEVAS